MQYYDMHSHILPNFDDGARDVEESLQLIASLKSQGITNICLTPHFYTNELGLNDFIEQRAQAFEVLKEHIPDDVRIVLGTEIYVTDYLFNNRDLTGVTYGKSKYILTEYPYTSNFNEKTMNKFNILMQNHGLIPVLPHVERYDFLMNNPHLIAQLQDMGVIIQSNISNYSKKASYFKKKKMLKMIDKGLIDILGSDAHSFAYNTPAVYAEAIKTISDKCGEKRVEQMMKTAEMIFSEAYEG